MYAFSGLCILLQLGKSQSQNLDLEYLNFRQFTEKEGANPILYNSFTDKEGFTWLSSLDLKRFDGHHFKTYFGSDAGYTFGEFFEDKGGRLFVMTVHHGVLKYDAKKDAFFPFQDSIKVASKKMALSGNVAVNSNGDVWLSGKNFIARLKNGGKRFEDITTLLKLPYHDFVSQVNISGNDQCWFSSDELGTIRIDTKSLQVTTDANNSNEEPIFDLCFGEANIKQDNNGNLWIIQFDKPHPRRYILRYNLKTNEKYTYVFPYNTKVKLEFQNTWVHNYFVDQKGTVWVRLGENVGIARYIPDEDRFEILYTKKHNEKGFEGGFIVGSPSPPLTHDPKTGNFWVASKHVMTFNPYNQKIGQISNESLIQQIFGDEYEQFETLSDISIRNIIQATNGKYYVSYRGLGIVRFDADFKNPKHLWFENNKATYTSTIFSTNGKTFYFGDDNSNMYSFEILYEKVEKIIDGTNRDQYMRSVFVENDTTVWIGHIRTGLSKFNPRTRSLKHYPIELIPKNIKTESTIYKIIPHGRHHLWLGTYQKGLQLFDKRTGEVVQQWSHQGKNIAHPKSGYTDILPFGKDTLLLASNFGVIVLNLKTMLWDQINTKTGLQDDFIMQILQMKNPEVVAVSSQTKGFEFVNLKTKEIIFPSEEQGNKKINFRTGSIVNNKGELVLASGHQGLITVWPSSVNDKKLELKLTELFVNDSLYAINIENPTKVIAIKMPESKNKLEVKFSVMDVWYCSSTDYFVKLGGNNTDWIKVNSPEVSYQSLGSGTYQLWIKARDFSSGRITIKHVMTLTILSPWYKTWWFASIFFIILSILIYNYVSARFKNKLFRENQKRKISELNEENLKSQLQLQAINKSLIEAKLQAVQAQMNPHFIFNSLNSIENFILQNDQLQASNYLNKFAKLIRAVLENTKQSEILLFADIESLKLYISLEQLRFRDKFKVIFDIDIDIFNKNYVIPPFLIQPFVENAIIHGINPVKGRDCTLIISIKENDDILVIRIIDDGIGRSNALQKSEHKSHGHEISNKRIEFFNNNKDIMNQFYIIDRADTLQNITGTEVVIHLQKKKIS